MLTCLLSLAIIIIQPTVSVYYGNPETNKCPSPIIRNMLTCAKHADIITNSTSGIMDCSNNTKLLTHHLNCINKSNTNINTNYEVLCVLVFILNFCFAFSEGSSVSIVDESAMRQAQLAQENRPVDYGYQRTFSALGALFGILVSNLSIDVFPNNNIITCYAGIFVAYGISTVIYGLSTILSHHGLSFREIKYEKVEDKELGAASKDGEMPEVEYDFWKTFTKTFFQYDILFFYSTTLISGL